MVYLGIDPGSRHTGFGVVTVDGERLRALAFGRITPPSRQPLPERLAYLSRELEKLAGKWSPTVAVLETPFLGLNPRSLVVLSQARGALLAVLAGRGIEIREFAPAEVKSAVTGYGRADKEQVARMVRLLLRLDDGKIDPDASDALALVVCYAHRYRIDRLTGLESGPTGRP